VNDTAFAVNVAFVGREVIYRDSWLFSCVYKMINTVIGLLINKAKFKR
jgi:hypothetical protein